MKHDGLFTTILSLYFKFPKNDFYLVEDSSICNRTGYPSVELQLPPRPLPLLIDSNSYFRADLKEPIFGYTNILFDNRNPNVVTTFDNLGIQIIQRRFEISNILYPYLPKINSNKIVDPRLNTSFVSQFNFLYDDSNIPSYRFFNRRSVKRERSFALAETINNISSTHIKLINFKAGGVTPIIHRGEKYVSAQ